MTPEHKALVERAIAIIEAEGEVLFEGHQVGGVVRVDDEVDQIAVDARAEMDAWLVNARAALSSPTAQTGEAIAVKPLEWDERSGAHYADTAFGEACIDEDGDGFYVIESGRKHSGFASVDAAKTFVQKNHNIWVNDWLTRPAPAVPDAVEAEVRRRLRWIAEARHDDNADLDAICTYADQALAALTASHMPVGDGDLPWCGMKVAFGVTDESALWEAFDRGELHLPGGWELDETDCTGARCVAIFRLTGIPTIAEGKTVLAMLAASTGEAGRCE